MNPTVLVIGLGGTITMTPGAGGGVAPALSAEQLLSSVPGLPGLPVTIETVDFRRVASGSLGIEDITAVAELIRARAEGVAGVVVVQGTDTIEETAYLLDLYHTGAQPVVVTGAMRHPEQAGADGPANLLAAVLTAASEAARDLGCLVVLADEIHAARRVRKTHTTAGSTFRSPDGGPLGYVVEDRPRLLNRVPRRPALAPPATPRPPRVPVLTMALGDDGVLLDDLGARVDGAVIAGFGGGHVPRTIVEKVQKLAEEVPVVLASRAGSGPVLTQTYGYPGSELDLIARGLVPAGFLDPLKARLLLCALLSGGAGPEAIAAAFAGA
ncbi:asparaginase [Dactylosporangium sp. CA-139066]|uniref:asparaginase n=1 Tax=Dactylosporangium sp. CA-139066 TaxID=3239930 RepID=UPI003D8AE7CD